VPYLNNDDSEDENPRVEALSDAAYRLRESAKKYAARNLTDGFVTLAKSRMLTATGNDATWAELVRSGLVHDIGEGCDRAGSVEARTCPAEGQQGMYLIHDYLQWNHSKAWWEKRRRDEAERKAKYRARKNGGVADEDS
jgi:hypothetical protein